MSDRETPKRLGEEAGSVKKVSDTLDFYNDSMPRRAVEGLFDKADKPMPGSGEKTAPVSGYAGAPESAHPKKFNEDIEESISIYSGKSRESRKKSFLEEDPLPQADIPARRRTPPINDGFDDDIDDIGYSRISSFFSNIDMENLPIFKIAVGAVVLIVIFIMVSFVFKINSVNARLVEANAKLAKIEDDSADYQRALIENSGLKEQITELEAEIEELNARLENPDLNSQTESPPAENTQAPQNGQTTPGSSDTSSYTVQKGDTLSSISNKFYGNSGEYQKIMDANGLKDTNIYPGEILRIPPK